MRPLVLGSILAFLAPCAWGAPPLVVEALYPGANAGEVEVAVALPLEKTLRGLEGVRGLRSVCADGRCVLRLDPDGTAGRAFLRVEVINRLQQVRRHLPEACKQEGVYLLPDVDDRFDLVAFWSEGKPDLARITNHVASQIEPGLARLPGVARVTVVGAAWPRVRITLDPDKLTRYDLTVLDVHTATREVKRPPRPDDLEELKSLIVGSYKERAVRLGDVGKVEMGKDEREFAGVCRPADRAPADFPAVLLLVHPSVGKMDAVRKALDAALAGIERDLPRGISVRRWKVADRAPTITLQLPDGVSVMRKAEVARAVAGHVIKQKDMGEVVWLARSDDLETVVLPFPTGGRKDLVAEVQQGVVKEYPGVLSRLRAGYDPTAPWPGRGMDLVVRLTQDVPSDKEPKRELSAGADELAHLLGKVKGVADASTEPSGRGAPVFSFELRGREIQLHGVRRADVLQTLQVWCGSIFATDLHRRDREWQVEIQPDTRLSPEDVKRVLIRNQRGEMVRLGDVCEIREGVAETVIYRVDGQRCVIVSCNVRGVARSDVDRSLRQLLKEMPKGISSHLEN